MGQYMGKQRTLFVASATLLLCAIGLPLSAFADTKTDDQIVTFCYENKELFPHYLETDIEVPEHNPGAAIEVIQQLDKRLPQTRFKFVRAPWKRCLNHLESGKVDALIARHTEQRAAFAQYPRNALGQVDNNKAFSFTSSCFLYNKNLNLQWDGQRLQVTKPIDLIAPSGYSLVQDLTLLGFDVYEATTVELAHKLLFKGKYQVSLSNCQIRKKPDFIVENPIPVTRGYGYLVFNKRFYRANTAKVEYIWQQLQQLDKASIYNKYQ